MVLILEGGYRDLSHPLGEMVVDRWQSKCIPPTGRGGGGQVKFWKGKILKNPMV
jgi:hypothetical protein